MKPNDEDLLWGENLALEEDDPTVHETFQAMMQRPPRVECEFVCTVCRDNCYSIQQTGLHLRSANARIRANDVCIGVAFRTIRRPDVEEHLLAEPDDEQVRRPAECGGWRISALRYHRLVIFEGGVCTLNDGPFTLHLDKSNQLGLQIR